MEDDALKAYEAAIAIREKRARLRKIALPILVLLAIAILGTVLFVVEIRKNGLGWQ